MSTRNIQFESADFGYLYGSCQFVVRPENKRYRLSFGTGGGGDFNMSSEGTPYKEDWSAIKPITDEEVVKILGGPAKWSIQGFVSMWQGWASGYSTGFNRGEQAALERAASSRTS